MVPEITSRYNTCVPPPSNASTLETIMISQTGRKLKSLQIHKPRGPDNVLSSFLEEYADYLVAPSYALLGLSSNVSSRCLFCIPQISISVCATPVTMDTSHVPNQGSGSFRVGCKKCGFTGHLTFQCRNYLRGDISGGVVLDVSSTTSQSDDDELITTALELKRAALAAKQAKKEEKRHSKSHKRKKKHEKSHDSASSNHSEKLHRTKHEGKSKKHRKHHRKKERQKS
ncbi:hypothetical protein P879_04258 [Paragonimus westermani]|uniref:CCHC-type domain-containing protein n=1 Tax=Paragonimus westermani TaxID=34504 RepID=A0A8T0DL65_9TREM|nr:hypothetical protein P879_04258 [Paragonimus westermani]